MTSRSSDLENCRHFTTTEIKSAFASFPKGYAPYSDLYNYIAGHNTRATLGVEWQAHVRKIVEQYSSDSKAFLGKEDLFHSVDGIGKGIWGSRSSVPPMEEAVDLNDPEKASGMNGPAPRIEATVSRVIRDTKRVRELKVLYSNRCQLCGLAVKLNNKTYSEGHHLKPLGKPHNGPDTKTNVIIACPNHHAQLDYGALAIHPVTLIITHHDIQESVHGCTLFVHDLHQVDAQYLKYHLDKIYR